MSIKLSHSIFCIGLLITASLSQAGDVNSGRTLSYSCGACHGPEGKSFNDHWPNLARQKQGYIILQLKAFREGRRYDPWMTPMATPLSDQEIADLAAFYSNL
jgi:cytochrome c553